MGVSGWSGEGKSFEPLGAVDGGVGCSGVIGAPGGVTVAAPGFGCVLMATEVVVGGSPVGPALVGVVAGGAGVGVVSGAVGPRSGFSGVTVAAPGRLPIVAAPAVCRPSGLTTSVK